MGTTNLIAVLTAIVQQGGTILVLLLRGSFLSVIYWYAACYCLRALLLFGASSRHFVMRSFLPGYFPDVVLRNWHYASRMLFTSITGFIYSQADRVIISKLMLVSTLGYYNVAYSTVSKATLLTSSVSTAAFPMLSDLFKSADRGKLMAQYYKLHDLLCVASIPLLAAVPFAAMPLFSYLFNPEVARQLLLPTVLLSAAFYMNAILTIPYTFSLAVGRPDIGARQHFFDLFVVPPLTVLLIYEFGIVGAALSSVLLYAFHLAYALRRLCSECLHISARLWFRHIARMLCLAGATYGVAFGLVWTQGSFHLDRLLLAYAVASLAFLCVAYFIVNSDLRLAILRQLPFRTNIGTGI
jgi:O-antigen/teichoic acid export membrane protein